MRAKVGWGLVWGAILVSCIATPTRRAAAANCALWARAQTGIYLYGAAGGWWDEAAGYYQRGHVPAVGSILVFRRTGHTPSGHVAVVSKVISANEILVDHANWYRGTVSRDMPVIDTSPDHDWTTVAVLDWGSGKYGRDNPTYGFVYPETGPREIVATAASSEFDPHAGAGWVGYEPSAGADLLHFAVAVDDRQGSARRRHRSAAHGASRKEGARHSLRLAAAAHGHARASSHRHGAAVQAAPAAAHPATTKTTEVKQHHRA
jgi:surface antigen